MGGNARLMPTRVVVWLIAALLVTSLVPVPLGELRALAQETDVAIEQDGQAVSMSNPRVRADSSMKAGQVSTWDCVWFGSYPQSEVAPGDSAYTVLQDASWNADGDATVGGMRYRRISRSDATSRYDVSDEWSRDGYGPLSTATSAMSLLCGVCSRSLVPPPS